MWFTLLILKSNEKWRKILNVLISTFYSEKTENDLNLIYYFKQFSLINVLGFPSTAFASITDFHNKFNTNIP